MDKIKSDMLVCKSCDIILGLHKTSEPYREIEYVKNQNYEDIYKHKAGKV